MAVRVEQKRQFPRIPTQATVRYQVRGSSEYNNTVADNLSKGGMRITDAHFIRPSTVLNLEVNLLSKVLNPVGKIAWASPMPHSDRYKLGIEFVEVDPESSHFISDYIELQNGNII